MRLFTGLSIPSHIIAAIGNSLTQLGQPSGLRWSPAENLHVTLKFIGEWPEARLPELENTLSAMPKPEPFTVNVARFGFLPNPHHPKIFFAGVHAGPGLAELANIDVKQESGPYTPHITLARVGQALPPVQTLRERIAKLTAAGVSFDFGSFAATEFHLYLSKPGAGGSVYTQLASYSLEKAAS